MDAACTSSSQYFMNTCMLPGKVEGRYNAFRIIYKATAVSK